ncbi:MAG: ATP-binding protein [Balneola sp.]
MAKFFKIDARLILQLGRESIKNHTTALTELVKNSYDADASEVEVEIFVNKEVPYIRISDNGFGMTSKEVEDNWLKIGFSEKKSKKRSQKGRRKTGEKGIGRIAADRLGSRMKMITKSESDSIQGIEVDWEEFDVDNKAISEIELKEIKSPEINIPNNGKTIGTTGTEILIEDLRNEWSKEDVYDIYQELSFFTPLFSEDEEFKIFLKNDIDPNYSKEIKTAIYETSEIELELHYDGKNELVYDFKNKINSKLNATEIFDLPKFYQRIDRNFKELRCGPLDLKISFFPRVASILSGTDFSLQDLRSFLDDNNGVKIYRDYIAVKPYGFDNSQMGKDWIGLDERKAKNPAGVARDDYRVSSNQIIGSIFITRDGNDTLKDSAAREGLVENEAFQDLKEIVLGSVTLLESYRVELVKQKRKLKPNSPKSNVINNIRKSLGKVRRDLEEIREYLNEHKDYKGSSVTTSIRNVDIAQKETERAIEELLEEKRILSALATLGISSAVFGHETQGAINTFKKSTDNALGFLRMAPPKISNALANLSNAQKQAKLIAGWGVFALARVEKDKRVKKLRSVEDIIDKVIKQVKPAFEALGIEIETDLSEKYFHVYPMDLESIILNLLTNSFNAVPNSKRERRIKIELFDEQNHEGKPGFSISVSDSGPGIAKEYISRVWDPLFTTKVGDKGRRSGTGLGLTIVKSIVEELNGEVLAGNDKKLKGARIKIWLPNE